MLAAAAVVWITLNAGVETPHAEIGRGWTMAGIGDVTLEPLFMYPDYRSGAKVTGGLRIARPLGHDANVAIVGRVGATYLDSWRGLFEAGAELTWRDAVEMRAGLRHDDRLSREGALADFRDRRRPVSPLPYGEFQAVLCARHWWKQGRYGERGGHKHRASVSGAFGSNGSARSHGLRPFI